MNITTKTALLVLSMTASTLAFAATSSERTVRPSEPVYKEVVTNEQWCIKAGGTVSTNDDTYGTAPYRGKITCTFAAR